MPARRRPIPVAAGADPADAVELDWSRFNWMNAERLFGERIRISVEAQERIKQATNHFARLAEMEDVAPPMAEASEKVAHIRDLTARLLREIGEIAMIGPDTRKPRSLFARQNKEKTALAAFLGHQVRRHLQLPPGRNLGRASMAADHLSILHESLCKLDSSLGEVLTEMEKPELREPREWHRWLEHICAALTDNGLPATASNDTESVTRLMALIRKLLDILPAATANEYMQMSNSALAKAIQRSRAIHRDNGAALP
jgi:hypothetical protein